MTRPVEFRTLVTAITLAALSATVMLSILIQIERPSRLERRLAAVDKAAGDVEDKLKGVGAPYAYPKDALCRTSPDAAVGALTQRINAAAGQAGVTLADLTASPGAGDEAAGGIAPVNVQFEATGAYASVIGLLALLGKSGPEVFVDAVDLKTEISQASLKVQGHIYCRPPVLL